MTSSKPDTGSMKTHELYLTPVAKHRMTQSDKWNQRPEVVKYRRYCEALNLLCRTVDYRIPDVLSVTYVLPMPPSWGATKQKAMLDQPHMQRPDLSNLVKAFEDALCKNDETIHTYVSVQKIWGTQGKIVLHID